MAKHDPMAAPFWVTSPVTRSPVSTKEFGRNCQKWQIRKGGGWPKKRRRQRKGRPGSRRQKDEIIFAPRELPRNSQTSQAKREMSNLTQKKTRKTRPLGCFCLGIAKMQSPLAVQKLDFWHWRTTEDYPVILAFPSFSIH